MISSYYDDQCEFPREKYIEFSFTKHIFILYHFIVLLLVI
jgi:hypothetical protein